MMPAFDENGRELVAFKIANLGSEKEQVVPRYFVLGGFSELNLRQHGRKIPCYSKIDRQKTPSW